MGGQRQESFHGTSCSLLSFVVFINSNFSPTSELSNVACRGLQCCDLSANWSLAAVTSPWPVPCRCSSCLQAEGWLLLPPKFQAQDPHGC